MTNLPGPDQPLNNLTREEAQLLIRESVREVFLMLGVKVDDPIEVQKDFQHLREWRSTTETLKRKTLLTMVGIVLSGMVGAVVVGIKEIFSK
ncbi:Phage protein [Xanthomonas phage Bosa]|uniref:Phage protein n=1 Tax=Xanthomonas phage Bosa TaxID=2674976 RepID=A0A679KKK3_9CAUD|nr:Phage protein [Xanthomonas phage Bosa]ATS92249.1 putative membrane protein [Stenotrophomonas phage DLP4]CAA2409891.1 Phage protein [Xanthomonas phage Bosa]